MGARRGEIPPLDWESITDVVNATNGNIIMASQLFGNSPEVAKKNYYTEINFSEATNALNKRHLS